LIGGLRIENKDKDGRDYRALIGMIMDIGCGGRVRKRIGMGENLWKGLRLLG